jgi:hypothetical protein
VWKPGEIAINRSKEGPMRRGEATCDESLYHCRDMAGNGCEWTRDLLGGTGRILMENPTPEDSVILRGKRYTQTKPWEFKIVDRQELGATDYLSAEGEFSFRVVIELN